MKRISLSLALFSTLSFSALAGNLPPGVSRNGTQLKLHIGSFSAKCVEADSEAELAKILKKNKSASALLFKLQKAALPVGSLSCDSDKNCVIESEETQWSIPDHSVFSVKLNEKDLTRFGVKITDETRDLGVYCEGKIARMVGIICDKGSCSLVISED